MIKNLILHKTMDKTYGQKKKNRNNRQGQLTLISGCLLLPKIHRKDWTMGCVRTQF